MRVYKQDANGEVQLHYDGEIVERGTTWVCLRAIFQYGDVDYGYVTFNQGDVFTEWFYSDRWYNVFRIEDGTSGQLKGWYCNITRPAVITEHDVRADDLALDLFVSPKGETRILDEDEFAELALSETEAAAAWAAVDALKAAVVAHSGPFADLA